MRTSSFSPKKHTKTETKWSSAKLNSSLYRIGKTEVHPSAIANPLLRKQASRSSARLCGLMQHWRLFIRCKASALIELRLVDIPTGLILYQRLTERLLKRLCALYPPINCIKKRPRRRTFFGIYMITVSSLFYIKPFLFNSSAT